MPDVQGTPPHRVLVASYGSDRYHFLRMRNMAPRTAHPEPPAIQLHPTHRQRTPQYAYVAELLGCGDLGHPERPARAKRSRGEMRAVGGLES